MEIKPPHVFISHNKADKNTAREIALFLVTEDINVWYDEWKISAGDSIVEQVNTGLRECTHFIIIWSRYSSVSNWATKELSSIISMAIKTKSPKIIPIMLDDTSLPPLINDLKNIKYQGGVEEDRKEIVNVIIGKDPTINFIKAIVKKYHEVIKSSESNDPYGVDICPQCGSNNLNKSMYHDVGHDEVYYIVECRECKFSDWTQ